MTELLINRPASAPANGSNGWKSVIIAGLFTACMAVIGWMATDSQTARNRMTERIDDQAQRIAVLEEANRNTGAALRRIEEGVNEIRRDRRR